MKAAIIGAGIGGLTTAIALRRVGIDYDIFEAAPALKPVGAGIVMASNAMQVFRRLGIDQQVAQAGMEIDKAIVTDQSFSPITTLDVKKKVSPRYGIGSYALPRASLQQVLLQEIDPRLLHTGKRLTSLEEAGSRLMLHLEDGSAHVVDIVIGADGIKSMARRYIIGDVPMRYSGQTCWRGMARCPLPAEIKNNSYEMWGRAPGLRFGFVPVSQESVYYFATVCTQEGGKDVPGQVKRDLLKQFASFGEIPRNLIEATPDKDIIRSDIHDFVPVRRWWKGKAVLLGDAAHATTPNLGQGGCQAVEDAFVLAQCLIEQPTVEQAFEAYQDKRYKKAVQVVNTSWNLGQMTNIGSPILRAIRNRVLSLVPESIALRNLDAILKLDY
jgi:2-polyprenyl-6-methoxyphenol hydroxylase-like FAD-dependent oxidoreductase